MSTERSLPTGLTKRGNVYYVRVRIPPAVSDQFNGQTHLRESLRTSDERAARALYPQAYARLKSLIETARRDSEGKLKGKGRLSEDEAVARAVREQLRNPETRDRAEELFDMTFEGMLGDIIGETIGPDGEPEPVYSGETEALRFRTMVRGTLTDWAEEAIEFKGKAWGLSYRSRIRKAARDFQAWYNQRRPSEPLDSYSRVSSRIAKGFLKERHDDGAITDATIKAHTRALGAVWKWALLTEQPDVEYNPWTEASEVLPSQRGAKQKKHRREPEDHEVLTLWNGPAPPEVAVLIRIGVLTGARLEEISRLQVGDIVNGEFVIRGGKTPAAARNIPIHPVLAPMIEALTQGKAPEEYLLSDLATVQERRGHGLSRKVTKYRKAMGVGENINGHRQADVVFHSLRKWAVTTAINAGCMIPHVQSVLGHAYGGSSTTADYLGKITKENRRAVVESLKLPEGCDPSFEHIIKS